MNTTLLAVVSFVSFLLAAFFAGAETAIIAADRLKIRHLAAKGNKPAKELLKLFANPGDTLSLVLVGTNLGVIGCTSTFTAVLVAHHGNSGALVATVVLVPLLLTFEEIIPKGVFLYYANRAAIFSVYTLKFFAVVLYPVVKLFSWFSNSLLKLLRAGAVDPRVQMSAEELLFHLKESRDAGLISKDTLTLASRVFELLDLKAADVMMPIGDVVMVGEGKDIEDYEKVFFETRFSRLPVYRGSRDAFAGILSIQSLLEARGPQEGRPELEDPYEVSAATPVSEILVRMQNQGCHMAMVRGDGGTLVGMTTLDDVLVRLVGALSDEFH